MTNDSIIADARSGDRLGLSRYLSAVTVTDSVVTMDGPALLVESSGGTTYRLRALDDDDDRLVLEKRAADGGWTPHVRVDAEPEVRA